MSNQQFEVSLFDTVEMSKPRKTKDGYLVSEAHVARTGIQLYLASELGVDGDPSRTIRVYRPPEEVFAKDAMASYAHRPVTLHHPPEMVDADNWKKYSRGSTSDEVMRDGERVRVPLILMDQDAIDAYENGEVGELSMGYRMLLDLTPGVTDDGESYDAVQRNLRMNHLALVARARGGSQLRLGDGTLEESNMDTPKLKTVTVDGLAVETTDAGAQAIAKLQQDVAAAKQDVVDLKEQHAKDLKDKDTELAQKDSEIEELKGKVLDDKALDAVVQKRADLIADAKSIADKDYTGMTADQIRKAAVEAKLGANAMEGKSNDYIAARFDILKEESGQDGVRKILRGGVDQPASAIDKAHAGHVTYLQNAWKGKEVS